MGVKLADDWADPPYDNEHVEAMDAAAAFARDIDRTAYDLRVRDAARRKVAAEQTGVDERPGVVALRDFLAVDDPAVHYRVDRLWPVGGRIVVAAQWKAGKTTLGGNLLRALADGAPFLDTFGTQRASRVVLLDDELDERTLRRWLRDQHIANVDAVRLVSLRGRVASFNLLDAEVRREWADALAGADVVILDCLRPVLDALGLDESREAGRFLVAFDALLRDVGSEQAADGLLVHHMGHTGERSRGDSRILDWPDASWKLVREDPDDPASPRYLSAFGRDVDVTEGRLTYDEATRRLTYAGGNRRESAAEALVPAVLDALHGHPGGLSGRKVEALLTAAGNGRNEARQALARAVQSGAVSVQPGPSNSTLHTLSAPVRHSAPPSTGAPLSECASAPIGAHGAHTTQTDHSSAPPAHRSLPEPGLSWDDLWSEQPASCTVCGDPLNAVLASHGETTHATCCDDGGDQ